MILLTTLKIKQDKKLVFKLSSKKKQIYEANKVLLKFPLIHVFVINIKKKVQKWNTLFFV